MRIRFPILLSAVLLAAAILMAFRDDLHAREPHRLNRPAEPVTECGFWATWRPGCPANDRSQAPYGSHPAR
jgi:hypothetical protein